MDTNDFNGFLIALGQEFCDAFAEVPGAEDIVPQDAYETFLKAFGEKPSPQFMASLSDVQLEKWRLAFEHILEIPGIPTDKIRSAVSRTLWRWPADNPLRPSA